MSVSSDRTRWVCLALLSMTVMVGCGSSSTLPSEEFTNDGGLVDGTASVPGADGSTSPVVPGQEVGPRPPVPPSDGGFVLFEGGTTIPDGSKLLSDGAIIGPNGEQIGTCFAGGTQCTNCQDDDGDGLYDWMDPECTGPLDNEEATYATGIPGDNVDLCKQDCFFDGNSGAGDDRCEWNLKCQSWSRVDRCAYDEKMASDAKQCPPPSQPCIDFCQPVTPKGCDCFGCCDVYDKAGVAHSVFLSEQCSQATLNDATKCPVCTKSTQCGQTCGECEFCLGKTSLPDKCYVSAPTPDAGPIGSDTGGSSGSNDGAAPTNPPAPLPGWTCQSGGTPCDLNHPCVGADYCLTGCCIPGLR